jgi:hypothetical protein
MIEPSELIDDQAIAGETAPEPSPRSPMLRLFADLASGARPTDSTTLTALGAAFHAGADAPHERPPARDS